jgi:serine/threonine-protein kinase
LDSRYDLLVSAAVVVEQYAGSYRLGEELGKGGMGGVFEAVHVDTGEPAAVKLMHPEVCDERSLVERFFNEARAASAIHHRGIVDIYDFGYRRCDKRAFIAMERLVGETVADRLSRTGTIPWPAAVSIARQICDALGAAHEAGIVHRDLKPANVFLLRDDAGIQRVKLVDFGIAKLSATMRRGPVTARGLVLGTPKYMAPEQCTGEDRIDARTDLYALGCLLFEMVCGRPVFEVRGFADLMQAHCTELAPRASELCPDLPPVLCTIIARLLEKLPEMRYRSTERLDDALALLVPSAAA